jgi:hypothetical protein
MSISMLSWWYILVVIDRQHPTQGEGTGYDEELTGEPSRAAYSDDEVVGSGHRRSLITLYALSYLAR